MRDGGIGPDDGGADTRGTDVDHEHAAAQIASCPGRRAEGRGQAELPGVEDTGGVERRLEPTEDLEAGAESPREEAGPVQPDAVVMADRGAVRQRRVRHHVPRLPVVTLPPFGVPLRATPPEREVEARPVGVGVRLVRRRRERALQGTERGHHLVE